MTTFVRRLDLPVEVRYSLMGLSVVLAYYMRRIDGSVGIVSCLMGAGGVFYS